MAVQARHRARQYERNAEGAAFARNLAYHEAAYHAFTPFRLIVSLGSMGAFTLVCWAIGGF